MPTAWTLMPNRSPAENLENADKLFPVSNPRAYAGTKNATKAATENILQTTLPPTREQLEEAMNNASSMQQIQDQREGIDKLAELARVNMSAPSQLDLSPLLALTDSWTGSKLASSYQRPQSLEERGKQGFSYLSDIQKRREDLSDKIRELAKGNVPTRLLIAKNAKINTGEVDSGVKPAPTPRTRAEKPESEKLATIVREFNADTVGRKARERLIAAQNAKKLVLSGNKMAPEAIKTVIPRLLGEVGNLAQAEQERVAGSAAVLDKFWRAWQRGTVSDFTDTDRAAMKELTEMFEINALNALNEIADLRAQQGYGTYGIPIERIKKALVVGTPSSPIAKKPSLDAAVKPQLSAKDKAALDWAKANPADPRAAKIKAKLGVK